MKILVLIIVLITLIGCTSLRYDDNLQEPYTQKEIEISGVGAVIITTLSVVTAGLIIDRNKLNEY